MFTIKNTKIKKMIGRGGHGKVYRCILKSDPTEKLYALKMVEIYVKGHMYVIHTNDKNNDFLKFII